jgi:hypothetical protein
MDNWDIGININVAANTEQEAEEIVTRILNQEMQKPALERNMNTWDFLVYVADMDEDPFADNTQEME